MKPSAIDIARCVEALAPLDLQTEWDNSGWQVCPFPTGHPVDGVMTCVDATPAIIRSAVAAHCNVVVSHHPTLFHGLKRITPDSVAGQTVIEAIRNGVAIYASHTPLDRAQRGINHYLADQLGLTAIEPLPDFGLVGNLDAPISDMAMVSRAKQMCGLQHARRSNFHSEAISRVGICSGAGAACLPDALAAGAQAFITADVRHHDFIDFGEKLLIIDLTHYATEWCATRILATEIAKAFPGLPVAEAIDRDPISFE